MLQLMSAQEFQIKAKQKRRKQNYTHSMLPQIQIIPSNLNLEQTNTKRLCFFNDTISINIRIKKETTDRVTCLSFKLKAIIDNHFKHETRLTVVSILIYVSLCMLLHQALTIV